MKNLLNLLERLHAETGIDYTEVDMMALLARIKEERKETRIA